MDPPFDSTLSGTTGGNHRSGEVPGTGLAWVGPPIADEKAATALDFVADYLFRDDTGIVTREIDAEQHAMLTSSASSSRCTIPASCA